MVHDDKLPVEDADSWALHRERKQGSRRLKHHHHHHSVDPDEVERLKEKEFWEQYRQQQEVDQALRVKSLEERKDHLHELYAHPGIAQETTHGIMIDAGSTGSRLHVYEWKPRVLTNSADIEDAVAGTKLSFPGTDTRWTDRLRPGLASFATIADDQELRTALADYLQPLMDFATTVLHAKQDHFGDFPIYLRATAGMRILEAQDRARVLSAVRELFHNATYCPFAFVDEQARTLSGEEEAIYDWAGVNFLMNDLIENSEGSGTVINPRLTHGALDLGGGSTQISFYETNEDIMSNLFKLQIGQAKHWNVYAHSFLFYGMNEAINRMHAQLAADKSPKERMVDGIYNPCLPGGSKATVRTDIHLTSERMETWTYNETYPSGDGFYQAMLFNDGATGDVDACFEIAKSLLHLEENEWCEFAHKGDCSVGGIYQPQLPTQSDNFGEFLAFSNYYHVWKFLKLPHKATLHQLEDATRYACSLDRDALVEYSKGTKVADDELDSYCFRSAFVFNLLHIGYGFKMEDTITATKVLSGHKVGWALGAMLYEINTLPWTYRATETIEPTSDGVEVHVPWEGLYFLALLLSMFVGLGAVAFLRRKRDNRYYNYEPVKEVIV